jgi:hypothetical protein
MRYAFALLFIGCFRNVAPEESTCSTPYVTLYRSQRCAELAAAIEAVANDVFPPLTEKLKAERWNVKVVATLPSHGQTYCDSRFVLLETDDWSMSALAHELFHVLECPSNNAAHVRWKDADSSGKSLFDREGLLYRRSVAP